MALESRLRELRHVRRRAKCRRARLHRPVPVSFVLSGTRCETYREGGTTAKSRQEAERNQLASIPAKSGHCVEDEIEKVGELQQPRSAINFGQWAQKQRTERVAEHKNTVADLADCKICDSKAFRDLLGSRSDDGR